MRTRRFLPLALLLAIPLQLRAQDPAPTVGVLELRATTIVKEDVSSIGGVLTDMMITELSDRQEIRLVERQQLEEVMKRLQLSQSAMLSDAQVAEIGRLVGANYMVIGGVFLDPKTARFDVRLVDSETSEVYRASKKTGKREDFLTLVEQLADEFTTNLKVPVRAVAAADAPQASVAATLAYSRGLDYAKRGKTAEAQAMFARALELFPEYQDARAALERIK